MSSTPRFTLIIPAWNEEALLPELLDSVDEARARCALDVEVIVVDNESTDRTAEIAHDRGCRVVRESKRVIAAVRNAGARSARGEIVAFIDADSTIHPETFNAIDRALTDDIVAGATGLKIARWSLGMAFTYAMLVVFVWATSIDAGVVFCRREDFETIGGYREDMYFAEDVMFLVDLRTLGKRRGQRLTRVRSAKGMSSPRKFDEHGEWHYLTNIFRSGYWYFRDRAALHEWGQDYWYRGRG